MPDAGRFRRLPTHQRALLLTPERLPVITDNSALLLQAKSAARSMSLKPASLTEVDVSLPVLPGVAVGILDEG